MPILNVSDWQIALLDEEFDPVWQHFLLLRRIEGSRWVVADAQNLRAAGRLDRQSFLCSDVYGRPRGVLFRACRAGPAQR